MIRSLHIIDHLGLGGAQAVLLDLARKLPEAGVSAGVAVLHGGGPFAVALRESGVEVRSLSRAKWPPSYLTELARLARGGGYDIVHFHLQGSNWLAKPIFAALGECPLVAHDHSSGDLRFRGIGSLLPDAATHACSTRIIAVSEGVRDFLSRFEGIDPARIVVIPNGIDTDALVPATSGAREKARARLGLDDGDFAVGAVGRLSSEKNFGVLVSVARECPRAKFFIAGDGPLRGGLERACEGTPVRLLGQISDRSGFYAALDAFVIPSLYEGLPMVLLEAMACGLPVVASGLPDIARVLGRGDCGRLADPLRPGTFARALNDFRDDPAGARLLGGKARRHCVGEHSAAAMAGATARFYRGLLEERGK